MNCADARPNQYVQVQNLCASRVQPPSLHGTTWNTAVPNPGIAGMQEESGGLEAGEWSEMIEFWYHM